MNIIILSEHIEGKFGKYSGINSRKLPDNTYMLPERVLSDEDLQSAKDLIISKQTGTTEILRYDEHETLEQGKVYQWDDPDLGLDQPSDLFICRQSHLKTIYKPSEIPALFTFFRDNADDLQWIQNEYVYVGWKRIWNNIQYECLQEHMTVEGQTPDITPALWKSVPSEEIIEWYQPTGGHDAFRIGDLVRYTDGNVYESLIDYNVYSPVAYPAGWLLREDLS